jgi:hypothetical protein
MFRFWNTRFCTCLSGLAYIIPAVDFEIICIAMCAVHEDHNWSLVPTDAAEILTMRRRWPMCCEKPVGVLGRLLLKGEADPAIPPHSSNTPEL